MESGIEYVRVKEEQTEDSASAVRHDDVSEDVTTTPITVKTEFPEGASSAFLGTESLGSMVVKEEPMIASASLAFHLQEERDVEIRLSADELAKYRSSSLCAVEEQPTLDGPSPGVSCDSFEVGSSVKLECLPSDELSDYEMDSRHMNDPLLTVGSYIQLYCMSTVKDKEKVKRNTSKIDNTLPTEKESSLSDDNDKHKTNSRHKCQFCTKQYHQISSLQRHMKYVHPDVTDLKCEICMKRFPNRDLKHHTDKLKCDFCMKGCSNKKKIARHIRLHIEKKLRVYKCEFCTEKFTKKRNLETHFRHRHKDVKEHKCEICKKHFRTVCNLNRHRVSHTQNYPFKCDFCMKGFTDKYLVTRHIRLHTGERPYKCEYCPKQFKVKSVLVRHSKIHTRFHQCQTCKKTYSKAYYFDKHIQNKKCNVRSDRDFFSDLKNKNVIK